MLGLKTGSLFLLNLQCLLRRAAEKMVYVVETFKGDRSKNSQHADMMGDSLLFGGSLFKRSVVGQTDVQ